LLLNHFENYPLEGNKALQNSAWLELVDYFLKTPDKKNQDQAIITELILKLSALK
jgi:hypothetical protein